MHLCSLKIPSQIMQPQESKAISALSTGNIPTVFLGLAYHLRLPRIDDYSSYRTLSQRAFAVCGR